MEENGINSDEETCKESCIDSLFVVRKGVNSDLKNEFILSRTHFAGYILASSPKIR